MGDPCDFNSPKRYRCRTCKAIGVKLWREYQTFLREDPKLLCRPCAEDDQDRVLELDGDQIGWMVPAVPTAEGNTFWGYSSVPQSLCDWWNALPAPLTPREGDHG